MNIIKKVVIDLLSGRKVSQGYDRKYLTTSIQGKISQIRKYGISCKSIPIDKNTTKYILIQDDENIKLAKSILKEWGDEDKFEVTRNILSDMIKGFEITPSYANKYNSSKIRQVILRIKNEYGFHIERERVETMDSFYINYFIKPSNIGIYTHSNNIPSNNSNYAPMKKAI